MQPVGALDKGALGLIEKGAAKGWRLGRHDVCKKCMCESTFNRIQYRRGRGGGIIVRNLDA